ncbi:hypothetical protein [Sphingomonas crocodyli]|uniref:Uncharacterized protein n=1 Tax=Sphingomonas crocodyli TaxID=1979270 RepID=A0A437M5Y1_9SPHN|nr:hypothetical protein [Sphingomonas crocodyli]RVT93141.1 hypothetical protein EOD43_04405 [Sphingomonas crocodyli]
MIGFATIGFFFTLEPIPHGYSAGQRTLTQAFDQAEADDQAHVAKVAAGEIDDIITDEASAERFDYGDHIYHIQESAKDMLNIHRQSYAVMLHHAWEKHVCQSNDFKEYRHRDAYRELSKEG